MMHYVWIALIGLVAGILAKLIVPGRHPGGIIVTALIGIAGAFVANFLVNYFHITKFGANTGFIGAVVGAIILLLGYRLITK